MKILLASPYLPWPLNAGGRVALYSSLVCLQSDHHFTFVCPVYRESDLADAAELQRRLPDVKIRAAYCGPPRGAKPAQDDLLIRGLRWGARQYRKFKHKPQTVSIGAGDKQVPAYPFSPLPGAFIEALTEELSQGPDLIQAEFAEMLSLGPWLPRDVPRIFIHHQLHFVYAQRFIAARRITDYSTYLESRMRLEEENYLRNFDGVIVFSAEDKGALHGILPSDRIYVSPFPIAGKSPLSRTESSATHFSFVGSEEHFPNRDALEWLTSEVWPQIRKQSPGAILKVIGPWAEASKARFSIAGVEFLGYVPDLDSAVRGSIMLVPLRIGSGIRVKLLDAMSQGIPAVSTAIGCEGIPVVDGVDILIRDDAAGFASASVELLNNSELCTAIAHSGAELIARFYSPGEVRRRRNEIYNAICGAGSRCVS